MPSLENQLSCPWDGSIRFPNLDGQTKCFVSDNKRTNKKQNRKMCLTQPDWLTIDGPTEYWNHSAIAITIPNKSTDLLRPVVPGRVEPKQDLQSDEPALQQQ